MFTFVPLHAAGIYEGPDQECSSDYIVSSYTPTLTALLRAQQGADTTTEDRITMLAMSAEQARQSDMPRLCNVVQEAQEVVSIASGAGILGRSDTGVDSKAEVLAMLQSADLVHLACHGIQDAIEPHKSRFCLSSGDLSVSELMGMDLKRAFIAFLSACETAKGDPKHADEAIHLAVTMLFAGFKSVVATMWCVGHIAIKRKLTWRRAMNDADGPYVAKLFYEKLFESKPFRSDAVPYALDHAVTALRMRGLPPERWATFVHMGA
jgi:CHAT domain-containing protein